MTAPSDITVFERSALMQRRERADMGEHGFLMEWAEKQVTERLKDITRDFPAHLDLNSCSNEEHIEAEPQSLDLITSTLRLHSVNDLPGTLVQIKRALKPDGLFLGALFGGETLHELRDALGQAEMKTRGGISPRVFPFADKQQMGALLQRAGFALPVVDSEIITVTYENMFRLMHDLRGMGENNIIAARDRRNPGKALFMDAAQYYADHYSEEDGRIRATFEIIFLIGWAPHASQQQPLKPGSAEKSLKEVL